MVRLSPAELDFSDIDRRLLDKATGSPLPVPAAEIRDCIDRTRFRVWMHQRAIYVFPTRELCLWLKEQVAGRRAIEIGAGNAGLCHIIKIPGTDSFIQQTPEMEVFYAAVGNQPRTNPPAYVMRMDANSAVAELRPEVVIGCFITRRFLPGFDNEKSKASIYGVDEQAVIRGCRTYIHIGNRRVHGTKTALKLAHQEIRLPGLVTRADPDDDVIYKWGA